MDHRLFEASISKDISKISNNIKAEDKDATMNLRKLFLLLCLYLTIAIISVRCATTSSTGVFPSEKDTYTIVVSSNSFNEDLGALHKKAYQEANEFCQSKGKVFQSVSGKIISSTRGNSVSFELKFRALNPDDPDYKRSDLETVPDVKVDVKSQ